MIGTDDMLEVANGVWAIVAFWLTVFLIFHIVKVWVLRKIPITRFLSLPLSMQLATGTLAVSAAVFMTRSIIWFARHQNNGVLDIQLVDSFIFVLATLLGIVGFLCILRTVTKPVFGHWPWISALVASLLYVIWWVIGISY